MQASHPIMLIRHAEKPLRQALSPGDEAATRGPQGLSRVGEQRAQALAAYFAPPDGIFRDGRIRTPVFIFAAAATLRHPSTRPADTVWPLATGLGLAVRDEFSSDPPLAPIAAALAFAASRGPALVSWRQDTLPDLARAMGVSGVPDDWPADRFDMVWLLERAGREWRLAQIPQMLLPGDDPSPIGGG